MMGFVFVEFVVPGVFLAAAVIWMCLFFNGVG